ncbi:MAG: hypothetical protein ABEJ40_03915 [Haloarculaceae archaeon]
MTEQARTRSPETKYTEFEVGGKTIGLIADVANERAWIQSTATTTVEP